jgi:hypothetical protein
MCRIIQSEAGFVECRKRNQHGIFESGIGVVCDTVESREVAPKLL